MSNFWFPTAITDMAKHIDSLFNLISVISAVVFVLVEVLLVFFLIRYRRRQKDQQGAGIHGNTKLEVIWTVIPALILVVLGIYSTKLVYEIQTPPADVTEVQVIGHKWFWEFKYPDGTDVFNDVVVPANTRVLFKVTAAPGDVIHGFLVPALRVQQDALPGRETQVWMKDAMVGKYDIICDQYCGTNHSTMRATMTVVSQSDYQQWLLKQKAKAAPPSTTTGPTTQATDTALVSQGKTLAQQFGCFSCHSIDGKQGIAPTWKGLYGSTVTLTDGSTVKADDAYIQESIVQPHAKIVKGFTDIMPANKPSDQQLKALVAYIKSLKG